MWLYTTSPQDVLRNGHSPYNRDYWAVLSIHCWDSHSSVCSGIGLPLRDYPVAGITATDDNKLYYSIDGVNYQAINQIYDLKSQNYLLYALGMRYILSCPYSVDS